MSAPFRRLAGLCIALAFAASTALAQEASDIERQLSSGDERIAVEAIDRLLVQRPQDAELRFRKAVILTRFGRTAAAADQLTQLTIDFPDMAEPYNNLAVIQAAGGELERARTSLETAVKLSPSYSVAHQNLGDLYVELAKQSYARALQIEPTNGTLEPRLSALRQMTRTLTAAPGSDPGKTR
jgi:Flp pilus assembly protein TadD